MVRRFPVRLVLWLLFAALYVPIVIADAPLSETNEFCPILPDEEGLDEFSVEYEGKTVRLCCRSCLHQFKANPKAYIHALPQFAASDMPRNLQVSDLLVYLPPWRQAGPALLLLALLAALEFRLRQQRGEGLFGLIRKQRHATLAVTLLLLVGLGVLAFFYRDLARQLAETQEQILLAEREKVIHNNTFYDFGFPPVPIRPAVAPRLQASFYRGNDERNEKLFNGGNYRTATMNIGLVLGDGTPVDHGVAVAGELLMVRLEIVRAPHTPDFFYEREVMDAIFLTRQTERLLGSDRPVLDRIDLTELEHMWRWEALFPIGRLDGVGEETLEGVIYVAEEWIEDGQMVGASLHYAIQYEIMAGDGILVESSDLWMGSLFRPRKTPLWRIPLEEWFSHEPIPELLEPHAVEDPDLLGVSDYVEAEN